MNAAESKLGSAVKRGGTLTEELERTDPELGEIIKNFISEIEQYHTDALSVAATQDTMSPDPSLTVASAQVTSRDKALSLLATLIGLQSLDAFNVQLRAVLADGLDPQAARELVYQSCDYLGIGRAFSFVKALHEVFTEQGISFTDNVQPVKPLEERLEQGNQVQVSVFGEGMRATWTHGALERRAINRWLAQNCFGDFYTRPGLSLQEREFITFFFLAAQGGCEPQLLAHANGNYRVGNSKELLYTLVHHCLPYMGYPRSLNALTALDSAAESA